jgi:2-dehydro-3-deoxyphosphogluconate aldolase / (4S)-4-hydroxy-2-oxoglutarate aldolase
MPEPFAQLLRSHRLLAIVRGRDREAALRTVLALADSGVRLIEVSLTSADALAVIGGARAELGPEAALGAGTVLSGGDAERAADAGASFLVTPGVVPDVRAADLPVLMGALTPSEIAAAVRSGAAAVKLFPASLGGPGYLRALRDPFPGVPFVPVGGVGLEAASEYLAAGACAVGVGSPLIGDAASGGDLDQLKSRISAWKAAGLIR